MRMMLNALALLLFSAPVVADEAPDFALRNIQNEEVRLSHLRGKVVLIDFWATWCGPCIVELSHIQTLYEELASEGLEVLAISTDDARTASKVRPFARSRRWTFPVLLDRQTQVVLQYNPQQILPYTVLVDRQGNIAWRHSGYTAGDEEELARQVRALLAEPRP